MSQTPGGRTRVSDAALDKIVLASARETEGVVDITGLVWGAVVGVVVGGAVGLAGGGGGGAAIGASVGSALGATTAHLMHRHRQNYHVLNDTPDMQIHLSIRYGEDLRRVADQVRMHVRRAVGELAGMDVGKIEVIFTNVVDAGRPHS